ncbi:MAG: type I DNA topoisomerase [Patescibacteria group bacterium]|nr:type I DNA topoisomerase [Patescibacteria group bacterium]
MRNLVIVESPTKANTISRFLGSEYKVESSYGHIRDLPQKKLGVNTRKNFEPEYVIAPRARKIVKKLKDLADRANKVYLATDEDREGEAIAWHLKKALGLKEKNTQRIAFHEITKEAILSALKKPREINLALVDAQQARRILDRLVGYKLSPFLWRKVARGLSAGRVQSVTVRLVCEREEEVKKFKPQEYWTIIASLLKKNPRAGEQASDKSGQEFKATLIQNGETTIPRLGIKTKKEADKILQDLKNAVYKVANIAKKEIRRKPFAPFTTSTLQQAAAQHFGFSTKFTMRLAQTLYEGVKIGEKEATGLITYMRTDSTNLAAKAVKEIREVIEKKLGVSYLPQKPCFYKTKTKSAQEAHEAIRPTIPSLTPEKIKDYLDPRQYKLYELIWKRAIACQTKEAVIDGTTVDIQAKNYLFRAAGAVIKFDGFLKIYPASATETYLPKLEDNEILSLSRLASEQHFTEPPARYNEASLVRALEKYGIGRPSTYAPIISTIQNRGYVKKIEKKFHPQEIGIVVNDLLVKHFPKIVDIHFTAQIEDELDEIANQKKEWVPVVREVYDPFIKNLKTKEMEISKKEITEQKTDKKCPDCGKAMVVKLGRFGKFLACTGYPECKHTEPLGEEKILAKELAGGKCEKCGKEMVVRQGRFGPFLACSGYPACKNIKSVVKKTGVSCPKCEKGEIIEKRSKKGRTFYACDQYPKCEFALWNKPTGKKCPECGSLLVFGKESAAVCSNKECKPR